MKTVLIGLLALLSIACNAQQKKVDEHGDTLVLVTKRITNTDNMPFIDNTPTYQEWVKQVDYDKKNYIFITIAQYKVILKRLEELENKAKGKL